jgi:hypothetical protein
VSPAQGLPSELAVLQVRPFAERSEDRDVEIGANTDEALLFAGERALGNGVAPASPTRLRRRDRFDRAKSVDVARDVAAINSVLVQKTRAVTC